MMNIEYEGPASPEVRVMVRRDYLRNLMAKAIEAADDIEAEVDARYPSRDQQPVQARRHKRDMGLVHELRAAIAALTDLEP